MLDDERYRALQEQAHLLAELEKHPGWPVLVDYAQAVVGQPLRRKLLNGGCKTFDDYQRAAGELAGIDRVLGAPNTVRAMLDNEQEQRIDRDEPLT